MANLLTGPIVTEAQAIAEVSVVQLHPLGTKTRDTAGNEYVYVQGVANGILGAVATFDEAGVTELVTNDTTFGPVCVFMAALTASTYGWGQIWGKATVAITEDVDDGDLVYSTDTDGAVSDTSGGSFVQVVRACFRETTSSVGVAIAQIAYPTMQM